MKPKNLSSGNKLLVLLLLTICLSNESFAQRFKNQPIESFLETQFWLGLRLGLNTSSVNVESMNSGFSPIDYSADSLSKNYEDFSLPGMQVGLEMNLYHNGWSISFQPMFKRSRFKYSSVQEWQGEAISSNFLSRYSIEQKLDLVELPLLIKYDVIRKGNIRPFVMIGGFYSIITSAQKELSISQRDNSSGRPLTSSGGNVSLGVKDAFKSFYGVTGGVGANFDLGSIRSVIEVGYNYSLSPFTRENERQEELIALGEVNDELTLNNINISLGLVFPFRFIDSSLQSR